jgi:tyrosine type site-specific recombinase
MFSISAQFRPSRSKAAERSGVVTATVTDNRPGSAGYRSKREVRLDISGADRSVIALQREEIIAKLRLLYCIIERLVDGGRGPTLDDIVTDYRLALAGNKAFADMISRAATAFPLRTDIVAVGREFRSCFEYVYPRRTSNPLSLSEYIDGRISALKNEGKSSLLRSYTSTHARLKDFTGLSDLPFSIISEKFIRSFADWLKSGGIAESTQSFYLRTLRSILNHAATDHFITVDDNWFREVDTRIRFDKSIGREALSPGRETLQEIRQLDLADDSTTALTRDMFMFGFYCRGMELVDIAHLTPENIRNSRLVYSRRKAGKEITVPLDPDAMLIISRYATARSRYLFPFLYDDGRVAFDSLRNHVQTAIKKIGKAVGFPALTFSMNITAYRNLLSQCHASSLL